MKSLAFLGVSLVLLTACSPRQDTAAAETSIKGFHEQLNAGQFTEIYADSSANLKQVSNEKTLTSLLDAVHRKLGLYQSGTQVGWADNVTTGGHVVKIVYDSKYELGQAKETFIYLLNKDGSAALQGYFIDSMALITN